MPEREGELAAGAGHARLHGAHRHAADGRRFLVGEALGPDQNQSLPQQRRQGGKAAGEIAHLGLPVLRHGRRFRFHGERTGAPVRRLTSSCTHLLMEDIADDGEAPRSQESAGIAVRGGQAALFRRAQGPKQRFLDQVVRLGARSREEAGEGTELRQQTRESRTHIVLRKRRNDTMIHRQQSRRRRGAWLHARDDKLMSAVDRAALIRALPYARRYARALTGCQMAGDAAVAEALRAVLAIPGSETATDSGARIALYRAIGDIDADRAIEAPPEGTSGATPLQRRLLLLTALEGQTLTAAADACRITPEAAELELRLAREQLRASAATRVLIIEDEPIIALDIQELVERCGHQVVGIAASEAEAVAIAEAERPGLVLADINLGAGGDGTSAVARILQVVTTPVIFVTAHPERLLTGAEVEPAFVITKPFDPTTLAVATYQAVTRGVPPGLGQPGEEGEVPARGA